ncbi:MAG TPA: hypothetical protein K8V55_01515 [Alistipes finegoldii]|uniref:hypothetical protein n=2 Tax=Alistipes finegoldii TaxID=214856 RepID=UPI001DBB7F9C|nr:hypothetical protein [Alistipes finegoldii]HJG72184.1 hypothetical protein [Alistipes finegoldii]
MKNNRIKLLLGLSCTLLLGIGGCTTDYMDDAPQVLTPTDETVGPKTRSLENAVFNEGAQAWMIPQNDPYTLENFQRAYDNLLSGNTTQPLTRSEIASIANAEPLKATHYRLKIYPKTEAEEWKIEKMEDVKVAYIPFDYVQLTKEESEKVAATTRAQTVAYPNENPYSVAYDDLQTCNGPTDPVTFTLPVLYAVWPCDKPLPEDMDYEIECEVFIPPYDSGQTRSTASTLSETVLQRLESEAISLALGTPVRPVTRTSATTERLLTGYITHWDNLLKKQVPEPCLKLRFQLGSNIWETYTHIYGEFEIQKPIPDEATFSHIFQIRQWKITTENSTAPIVTNYGTVGDIWKYVIGDLKMSCDNPTLEYTINVAAAFFYTDIHELTKWQYNDGIRIISSAKTLSDNNAMGEFYWSKTQPAYIVIYCYQRNVTNQAVGTVFHEIGHFVHYSERGGAANFSNVHKFIVESYASYAGWYLTELYYKQLGYIKPADPVIDSSYTDYTHNARQNWVKTTVGTRSLYSPLFVDLVDDYNQEVLSELRPDLEFNSDLISNVPHSVIQEMAYYGHDWYSIRQILEKYVDVYYSFEDFKAFKAPYEYWFRVN